MPIIHLPVSISPSLSQNGKVKCGGGGDKCSEGTIGYIKRLIRIHMYFQNASHKTFITARLGGMRRGKGGEGERVP
jgi:hypothetical protein